MRWPWRKTIGVSVLPQIEKEAEVSAPPQTKQKQDRLPPQFKRVRDRWSTKCPSCTVGEHSPRLQSGWLIWTCWSCGFLWRTVPWHMPEPRGEE